MTTIDVQRAYATDGYVVLREALDADALRAETRAALDDAYSRPVHAVVGGDSLEFRYVPMMCERTPHSIAIIDRLAPVAEQLLGRPVLPVRAKGVWYAAETAWHRDSVRDLPSVGFLAYLDDLRADRGALRVKPRSHLGTDASLDAVPVETAAGDVIAMDEHLEHASFGGAGRLQWRIDFVADPATEDERADVVSYFEGIFAPGWAGGYDSVKYPSYGSDWLLQHPEYASRLAELGALAAAARHESAFA